MLAGEEKRVIEGADGGLESPAVERRHGEGGGAEEGDVLQIDEAERGMLGVGFGDERLVERWAAVGEG